MDMLSYIDCHFEWLVMWVMFGRFFFVKFPFEVSRPLMFLSIEFPFQVSRPLKMENGWYNLFFKKHIGILIIWILLFWLCIKAYVGYISISISPKELAFGDKFFSSKKALDLKLTLYELDCESIVLLYFKLYSFF